MNEKEMKGINNGADDQRDKQSVGHKYLQSICKTAQGEAMKS
jgi:hypothetical protein